MAYTTIFSAFRCAIYIYTVFPVVMIARRILGNNRPGSWAQEWLRAISAGTETFWAFKQNSETVKYVLRSVQCTAIFLQSALQKNCCAWNNIAST